MAEITLDRNATLSHLLDLLKLLAKAMAWVSQRDRKVTFEVPDGPWPTRSGESCFRHVSPTGRNEAELLIGILKKMSKKGEGE